MLYRGENAFVFDDNPGNRYRSLTIDPSDIQDLVVKHEVPRSVYPYFGLGYGRAFSRHRFVKAAAELGFIYHDNLRSSLRASGGISPAELEEQQQLVRDRVSGINLIPVLNVQVSFRIF